MDPRQLNEFLFTEIPLPCTKPRFYHEGLDRLAAWSNALRPGASENYLRVSDKALHQFMEEIAAPLDVLPKSDKAVSFASIERTLASRPEYECSEATTPGVEQITCPATLALRIDCLLEGHPDLFKRANEIGADTSLLRSLHEAFDDGMGVWFEVSTQDM
ncbi:MAG: hypothetical protein GYA55_06190 [SAR324 cluster bacterium]|uniref:Uncharacterized protein n=1 Tax=SAR324 cluster bacterium TaxID=2024889 RepID=A0A7X9IK53_9DELT|nr:hypothetical protein [SAR324 cluster bacterium]